jgi:hypothetical protein
MLLKGLNLHYWKLVTAATTEPEIVVTNCCLKVKTNLAYCFVATCPCLKIVVTDRCLADQRQLSFMLKPVIITLVRYVRDISY